MSPGPVVGPGVLVMAKAPVPGLAKTRIASVVGDEAAADLAAAAFLDTLAAVEAWAPASRRIVAMTGTLAHARRADELATRLRGWQVVPQRGASFAERLVHAHHDAAASWGATQAVLQIGMDTPQLIPADLAALSRAVTGLDPSGVDAVLGPATDGGWWALATRRAGYVDGLVDVAMSTPYTCQHTATALSSAGARVGLAHMLSDVDVLSDATDVAALAPATMFARAVRALGISVA